MMSPSAKVKQGIHPIETATECMADEPYEVPLSYMLDSLTPNMVEEARLILDETVENRTKGLEELRRLIKKDEKLVSPVDDTFLLAFLRSRKFNVKKAFKLLQNYWMFRKEHKSIYDTSDSTSVKNLILKNIIGSLPYRDRNGSVVMVFKVGQWNPEEDVYEEMFRAVTAILIHSIQFPATQVAGYRMILDTRGLSWPQLKMCTPSNIMLLVHSTQYCFPARYRGFHILSESKLFNLAWTIAYPLLTSKLRKRIIHHGSDLKPLLEYINPSVLPFEYGGEAGPFENSKWIKILEESTDQVMELLNYGYKD